MLLVGKKIRKLNFERADSPVLGRVLRDTGAVARKEGFTTRDRLDLTAGR